MDHEAEGVGPADKAGRHHFQPAVAYRNLQGVDPAEVPAHAPPEDRLREQAAKRPSAADPGKPEATRAAILKVVDAENPPLRIFFGKAPLGIAERDYESRLQTWREWQPVSEEAHGS